jgi:hypothetical protein
MAQQTVELYAGPLDGRQYTVDTATERLTIEDFMPITPTRVRFVEHVYDRSEGNRFEFVGTQPGERQVQ